MNMQKKTLSGAILVSVSMLLAACNDDDPKPSVNTNTPAAEMAKIEGVAATGKPFAGKVEVVNAQGKKSEPSAIKADGTFSVDIAKGAPYLIRAFNDNQTLYSYAKTAGYANVTQLTTAALYDANAQMDLADLYATWADAVVAQTLTDAKIEQAAAVVVANLRTELSNAGLTTAAINRLNVFNYEFKPIAGNAFDGVLDDVNFSYTCSVMACTANYAVNGKPSFTWQYNIDTSGISFDLGDVGGGEIPTGNYTLKITTTVSGFSTTANIGSASKPANQSEFCSNTDLLNNSGLSVTQCSFDGTKGSIKGTLSGLSYSYLYEYIAS